MKDALLAELDREAAVTRRMLERVPSDKFDWKPHEKSSTMGKLAAHIATLPRFAANVLKEDVTEAGGHRPAELPQDAAEIIVAFEKSLAEARSALERTSDDELGKPWKLTFQEQTRMELPKHAAIQIVGLNHLVHHRAQLGVYLRLNDIPIPSSYGPSADEKA